MTIQEAINLGQWEEFFLTKAGEKLPKTPDNVQKWLANNPETKSWSSVSQKINNK